MHNVAGFVIGVIAAACLAAHAVAQSSAPVPGATVERVYTPLDLEKCKHTKGREVEDYGSWRCAGYNGIPVRVSAGDQRTYVSFGSNAAKEIAAGETLALRSIRHSIVLPSLLNDASVSPAAISFAAFEPKLT